MFYVLVVTSSVLSDTTECILFQRHVINVNIQFFTIKICNEHAKATDGDSCRTVYVWISSVIANAVMDIQLLLHSVRPGQGAISNEIVDFKKTPPSD